MFPIRREVHDLRLNRPRVRQASWGILLAGGLALATVQGAGAQSAGSAGGGAAGGAQSAVVGGASSGGRAGKGGGTPEVVATMKGDLRRLVSANEVYHAKNGHYGSSVDALQSYHASPGVTITILSATAGGWAAQATAASMPGKSCVISVGSVPTPPTTLAEKRSAAEAVAVCDQP